MAMSSDVSEVFDVAILGGTGGSGVTSPLSGSTGVSTGVGVSVGTGSAVGDDVGVGLGLGVRVGSTVGGGLGVGSKVGVGLGAGVSSPGAAGRLTGAATDTDCAAAGSAVVMVRVE
tara:strand:+ start:1378 stop:1725 length:348 start_codon:yes stop_codon:yes gene_type:complete